MKRTEIKAGVIYALKTFGGTPDPIVFLEDGAAATVYRRERRGDQRFVAQPTGSKPENNAIYGSSGYAVVERDYGESGDDTAALRDMDTANELERFRTQRRDDGYEPGDGALRFSILTSLAKVIGPYDEVVEALNAEDAAQQERARSEARRLSENLAAADTLTTRLREHGVAADHNGSSWSSATRVEISLEEAAKLLAILDAASAPADV